MAPARRCASLGPRLLSSRGRAALRNFAAFPRLLCPQAKGAAPATRVVSERYERSQPIILTSNKAFSDWGQVVAGDAIMATAALDRLLHRSAIVNIRGDSFRLKQKRQAKAALIPEVTQP